MTDQEKLVPFTSSRFGDLQVPEAKIISVPEGIIGFPEFQRYALLDPSGGTSLFLWLQAVDSPDLAFIITDPTAFLPDYRIQTSEPEVERLGIAARSAPALFVIVTIPRDDPDRVNVNLLAPLLYFAHENALYQVVLEKSDWPLRHYLLPHDESRDPAEWSVQPDGEHQEVG